MIIKNFSITLQTPSGPLPEYTHPDPSTTYICVPPPTSPQRYSILITPLPTTARTRPKPYAFRLVVDGIPSAYLKTIRPGHNKDKARINGLWVGNKKKNGATLKELKFEPIRTIEEDEDSWGISGVGGSKDLEKLGVIEVEVREVRVGLGSKEVTLKEEGKFGDGVIGEKEWKGREGTHRTKLGRKLSKENGRAKAKKKKYRLEKPCEVAKFLYRSRTSLQCLGLIPPDSEVITINPDSTDEVEDGDESDDDQPARPRRALKRSRAICDDDTDEEDANQPISLPIPSQRKANTPKRNSVAKKPIAKLASNQQQTDVRRSQRSRKAPERLSLP